MALRDAFFALADPTRRDVLRLLRQGPLTAGELAERFPLAKSTLSGHFNVLKAANLVVAERHGTAVLYSLNLSAFEEAMSVVLELLSPGDAVPAETPKKEGGAS